MNEQRTALASRWRLRAVCVFWLGSVSRMIWSNKIRQAELSERQSDDDEVQMFPQSVVYTPPQTTPPPQPSPDVLPDLFPLSPCPSPDPCYEGALCSASRWGRGRLAGVGG